jgi:hypothetical protein
MPTTIQSVFHDLSHRNQIGAFLNSHGLTGKGVEVGTLHGSYAEEILKTWRGHLFCVDVWVNQPKSVYFDSANLLDMDQVFATAMKKVGGNSRCTLLRMMSLNAVGKFEDGELDFVFLDGNHAVDAARADISAWWPKVKIGGIISGHDCNTRYDHETNSDAATAVFELCEAIEVRPHLTWCTSWWIQKTAELDRAFREATFARPTYTDNSALDAVVVIPVARFDWNLAVKFLKFWATMKSTTSHRAIAWCSPDLTAEQRIELEQSGPPNCRAVVAPVKELGYFGTANQMIRTALEYCEREYPGCAVLWAEADCVPMRAQFEYRLHRDGIIRTVRASWVDEIIAEYRACGRPFMGDIHRDGPVPHLTGNAVYHPAWRTLAPSIAALGTEACGWDSLCAHDTLPRAHRAKTIQQIWRPPLPITAAWAKANIRPTTALFHQCKDGSLIDVLSDAAGLPKIPLAPALCVSTYERQGAQLRARPMPPGVPPAAPKLTMPVLPAAPKLARLPVPVGLKVHFFITSFKRDVEYTGFCIRSIAKQATGFSGATLVIPDTDARFFGVQHLPRFINVITFKEEADKGFLHHMIQVCRADELCPAADVIVHVDPDCMFWQKVTPADYVAGGKCLMVREHYDILALRQPNRLLWRGAVEAATGITPTHDLMVRHPNVYPRAVYGRLRQVVEAHTGMDFNSYVFSRQNKFPQGFAEYPALGSVGLRDFPDSFEVVDYDYDKDCAECGVATRRHQYCYRPQRDKLVEGFSYTMAPYRNDWNRISRGIVPQFYLK